MSSGGEVLASPPQPCQSDRSSGHSPKAPTYEDLSGLHRVLRLTIVIHPECQAFIILRNRVM